MYYLNMWFRQNLGLKVISVIIAFCLWAYVMVRENPAVTREFEGRIVIRNTPDGLTVLTCSPQFAKVEVSGLRRLVQGLSPAEMVATVDLSGQDAGEHMAPLTPPDLPPGVSLQSLSPQAVRVVLDRIVTETCPLAVRLHGEPAAGYALGTPQLNRTDAKVTGAASLLGRLSRVVADTDAAGLSATAELTATVRAVDEQGEVIEGLQVSPTQVAVVVPVTREAQTTKTVPVRPQTGRPAEGYEVKEVKARPDEVTLTGSPEALAALESVSTEEIPLAGVTDTETYKAKLILPTGVNRIGEGPIEVTVTVAKRAQPEHASPAPRPGHSPEAGSAPGSAPSLSPPPGGEAPPPASPGPKPRSEPGASGAGSRP
jgi:YbbR domain-containing protein